MKWIVKLEGSVVGMCFEHLVKKLASDVNFGFVTLVPNL